MLRQVCVLNYFGKHCIIYCLNDAMYQTTPKFISQNSCCFAHKLSIDLGLSDLGLAWLLTAGQVQGISALSTPHLSA
jgi:hypothetical protein